MAGRTRGLYDNFLATGIAVVDVFGGGLGLTLCDNNGFIQLRGVGLDGSYAITLPPPGLLFLDKTGGFFLAVPLLSFRTPQCGGAGILAVLHLAGYRAFVGVNHVDSALL